MRLRPSDRLAIRELFLRRRIEYTTKDAARLLRINLGDVLAMIEAGKLHAETRRKRRQLGGRREALILWGDLAAAALRQWTPVQVYDALGEHASQTVPDLFRPVELKGVRLPAYQIRLLEALARRDGVKVEDYLTRVLAILQTVAPPAEIERVVPGITATLHFP